MWIRLQKECRASVRSSNRACTCVCPAASRRAWSRDTPQAIATGTFWIRPIDLDLHLPFWSAACPWHDWLHRRPHLCRSTRARFRAFEQRCMAEIEIAVSSYAPATICRWIAKTMPLSRRHPRNGFTAHAGHRYRYSLWRIMWEGGWVLIFWQQAKFVLIGSDAREQRAGWRSTHAQTPYSARAARERGCGMWLTHQVSKIAHCLPPKSLGCICISSPAPGFPGPRLSSFRFHRLVRLWVSDCDIQHAEISKDLLQGTWDPSSPEIAACCVRPARPSAWLGMLSHHSKCAQSTR